MRKASTSAAAEHTSSTELLRDWDELFSLLAVVGQRLVHVCHGPSCCRGFNRRFTVARIVRALLRTVFRHQPSSPELGKWTKFGPALDLIVAGGWCGDVFAACFRAAFGKGSNQSSGNRSGMADLEYMQDMHWHEVKSKRATASVKLLDNQVVAAQFVVLTLANEPLRILLRVLFIYAGVSANEPSDGATIPAFCHFVTSRFSPFAAMLQYIGSFLSVGSCPRLHLLLGKLGVDSERGLWALHRDRALELRRSMMRVAAGIHLRHQARVDRWPWLLARVVDPRLNYDERRKVSEDFMAVPPCCLDLKFGRKLRTSGWLNDGADDLMGPRWQRIIFLWLLRAGLTNARIEFKNAKDKLLSQSKCCNWYRFVGKSLCSEVMGNFEAEKQTVAHHLRQITQGSGVDGEAVAERERLAKDCDSLVKRRSSCRGPC